MIFFNFNSLILLLIVLLNFVKLFVLLIMWWYGMIIDNGLFLIVFLIVCVDIFGLLSILFIFLVIVLYVVNVL